MTRFAQRYVLEREVGAGGMARVFLATDEVLGRPVAIKILNSELGSTDIAERFRREGRTAARLSHPNIVQVFDAGEDELEEREVSYIVMEYVPGGDLKALIDREGPIPNDALLRLGADVSSGLSHAHERGVIHRDIKPHNILLDEHGRPKLTDFGIARALDTSATPVTRTGAYLGTALYSSPEQLRGEKVTPKSDVYSLGATLYQAAVGEAPFTGTPIEIASQHVNQEPEEPRMLGADLSSEVETLILKCFDKDPDNRPTAEEVHNRLLAAAGPTRTSKAPPPDTAETIEKAEPPPPPREEPPPGYVRHRDNRVRRWRIRPVLLAAAVLLLALAGAAVLWLVPGSGTGSVTKVLPKEVQPSDPQGGEGQYAASTSGEGSQLPGLGSSDQEEGSSPEDAAALAVEDHYAAAVDGDYEEVWNLLSSQYRQQFASREAYTGQFDTLQDLTFDEGPTAEISSDGTATVTGETTATHDDRTEQNSGTWTLVNEDGGWKIDGQNVSNISTDYS